MKGYGENALDNQALPQVPSIRKKLLPSQDSHVLHGRKRCGLELTVCKPVASRIVFFLAGIQSVTTALLTRMNTGGEPLESHRR